ncbi:BsuPI-related putative proteinase inhibitor [Cytobacillus sp. FJAT-54145]|uniref:Intracellular proteinase inhibitor BsuPI domain-containing protein n=1 Tax=Cytobacillus spartinae TaxID=3299023 RepID=A0ABW6KF08_9BACI
MKKLLLILLLGIVLTGCGTGNEKASQGGSGIVAGEVQSTIEPLSSQIYQYEVKNQTEEEIKLDFTSSQRFDYSIKTSKGKDVYLFSSVAMFLQATGEEKIQSGESLTYEIDLKDVGLSPGDYVLTVWMTPKDGKAYSISKEFKVE